MIVFFFNDTATTEIYTLSLHDALPICPASARAPARWRGSWPGPSPRTSATPKFAAAPGSRSRPERRLTSRKPGTYSGGTLRSEEHTSELQSRQYLVCRLLLEKKKLPI